MFFGSLTGIVFAFFSTFSLIPLVNALSLKFHLVDKPEKRKQHKKNIVRLGGVGILLGIYIAILFLFKFNFIDFSNDNLLKPIFYSAPLFFFLGLIDDIYVLSPFIRLVFQFFLAIFVWSQGIQINTIVFQIFGDIVSLDLNSTLSIILTIFWIVGMINAINWMDGLDGLASGIICIAIVGLIIITLINGNSEYIFLLFSILGACLAFLIHNIYPAKILMGDGGSYLLGFFAASLSIYFTNLNISKLPTLNFLIIQLFLLFTVPILDMAIVIFFRLKDGKSIFLPDRNHIHHRLIDLGFSHKDTVIIIFAVSQFFVAVSILFSLIKFNLFLIISSSFLLGITLYSKCDPKSLLNLKISPRIN